MARYDDAEAAATIALEYDPRMIKARFRRGLARKEMGQLEAALVGKRFECDSRFLIVIL